MRNKIMILPKLYDAYGDMKKRWHIYFSYKNPANNKMERIRIYDGFSEIFTKKGRYAHADKMIREYSDRLKNGWNPLENDIRKAVYEDSLQYVTATRIFREQRITNMTFNYYSNKFLPEIKGMSHKTYINYVSKYRLFDAWLKTQKLAENDISSVTRDVMRDFFLYLINDQQLARITIQKYRNMLDKFFNWCIKNEYMSVTPMQDLPSTTRENDQAPRPIHVADINKLIERIKEKDQQLWLAVQLEYYCFLRPGLEIRMSKVGWFDLDRGTINVPKEVVKTKENKIVIIPNQLREQLINEWRLHLYPTDYFVFGKNGMPGKTTLGSNTMRSRFNVIRDSLGLPKIYKLYSWKHTGNAHAADAGISMYDRQRQNGHQSSRSTEEYMRNKIGFVSDDIENKFPDLNKMGNYTKRISVAI